MEQRRNPPLHQTANDKRWYFGMKAHVRFDSRGTLMEKPIAYNWHCQKPATSRNARAVQAKTATCGTAKHTSTQKCGD